MRHIVSDWVPAVEGPQKLCPAILGCLLDQNYILFMQGMVFGYNQEQVA
jgi:hypothetical protein